MYSQACSNYENCQTIHISSKHTFERLVCEVEFLGGVVLEERTFDNFSVGRYSTAHYQVVDLEDVQLRIVKVPQTIRLRAQRQRRPRYVSIRYANQDARPTVHRLANSCVSHDYLTFFCYFTRWCLF